MNDLHRTRSGADVSKQAYFPRQLLTDFFRFLKQNAADLEIITYADLPWGDDCDYEGNYPEEFRRWKKVMRSSECRHKAYVLIQYDVDTAPERTMALLADPEHRGIPVNTMVFNQRIDRSLLKEQGLLRATAYDLDYKLLQALEGEGFVTGYHSNAMERALFDPSTALQIFDDDVEDLSRRFDVRFFSAHGGVVGPNGEKNRMIVIPHNRRHRLKWVHNGHTVRFDASISDGGHNAKKIAPSERDLRDFVRRFRPGHRYRIVIHPQYYGVKPRVSPNFSGTSWYDELMTRAEAGDTASLWSQVRLGEVA